MSVHDDQSRDGAHRAPVTLRTIRRMMRDGVPFASLACYDAVTATWLERAGIELIIVGDSAAQLVLGYDKTLHMPLEISIALTAGVKRGAPTCMVMADMPFMSYHASEDLAVVNAGRFMTEGLADIVKLEIDSTWAPLVRRLTRCGIPVCPHIGLMPQRAGLDGGYTIPGRTAEDAERIVQDAVSLEEAGAVMLLLEASPSEVAEWVVATTNVPVIGIGAGPAPHGQVLVLQDILGMTDRRPSFAPVIRDIGPAIQVAAEEYIQRVRNRTVTDHRYEMKEGPRPAVQPR